MWLQITSDCLLNSVQLECMIYDTESAMTRFYLAGDCTNREKNYATLGGNLLPLILPAILEGIPYLDLTAYSPQLPKE